MTDTSTGPGLLRLRPPAHRASSRARLYWTLRALPGWLLVGVVEGFALVGSGAGATAVAVTAGVTAAVALTHLIVMPQWRYRVHRWEVTGSAVYVQEGWLLQERRIAPLARVQTVDTHRGLVEQVFGLANVTVTTASAKGPLHIKALDLPVADGLVGHLTERAQAAGGDGT